MGFSRKQRTMADNRKRRRRGIIVVLILVVAAASVAGIAWIKLPAGEASCCGTVGRRGSCRYRSETWP